MKSEEIQTENCSEIDCKMIMELSFYFSTFLLRKNQNKLLVLKKIPEQSTFSEDVCGLTSFDYSESRQ